MRNKQKSKIEKIMSLAAELPYFSFSDLSPLTTDKIYLKILFSRYRSNNKVVRLKRGMYAAKKYLDEIEKSNKITVYSELLAYALYQPSYLSLDYILYQNNILTEMPQNFTSVTLNKTAVFSNPLGNFFYHNIKPKLFQGFTIEKDGDFMIWKATAAKALFDFLYFRKNLLPNQKTVKELRLNWENFSSQNIKELRKYINIEGSHKMKKIWKILKILLKI